MNRIESAVTSTAAQVTPLDSITTTIPVATPFIVVGVVAGAFVVGAGVGCAEGHCVQDASEMTGSSDLSGMSVSSLLAVRNQAI